MCRMPDYCLGKQVWVEPSQQNCLPVGWRVGFDLRPTNCTRKRGHLQVISPELDFVLRVHNRGEAFQTNFEPDVCDLPDQRPEGLNFVETPCTCTASLAHALENRQCAGDPKRPWNIPERHKDGYRKQQHRLTKVLWAIIRQQEWEPKTLSQKAASYSGTKRVHYEKCAKELEVHPLTLKEKNRIFHDASVKWGELSSRPRALLVQSIRAKGVEGVKEGELLRAPILVEGCKRDLEEHALHKFMHADGHHYVASGMSLHKRARKIKTMVKPGDVVLSIDLKTFDGKQGETAVIEREEFLKASEKAFGVDEQLRAVIETQNRSTLQAGPLRGALYGNRGSGTAGTSTANKKVVLAALFYALGPAAVGRRGVKFFCDGDDTLIIVPRKFQTLPDGRSPYASWARRLSELGLDAEIQQVLVDSTDSPIINEIRFCRASIVETPRGPFLCKVPTDALKVATNFRRHFRGTRFADYCQTLSTSFFGTYGDVPVLCKLSGCFDVGGRVDTSLLENSGIEHMMQKTTSNPADDIDDNHRVSYMKTWGVTPTLQIACERALEELAPRLRAAILSANF